MFYIDSQRTLTRRDSSLIVGEERRQCVQGEEGLQITRPPSTVRLTSESALSLTARPSGCVRNELITLMFESMLDSIVESWDVIEPPEKPDESVPSLFLGKSPSEVNSKKKGKGKEAPATKKSKRSRSKITISDSAQTDASPVVWWSAPDERALIRFKNGNCYEGNISAKCMHGEGRFQWADGTVYLGQFKNNEINGKGMITWKDDTWYEGDFVGNLRHGRGLYVDSRRQRSYHGGWYSGAKHGHGVIYYSKTFKNSYDGDWVHNVRHGFGAREYCENSGYKGEWDLYVRDGKGLMIWPNHDFYRGFWKNGVMSGYGIYIWDAYYNKTMSAPSITAFRGHWHRGKRNGYGVLNLGLGLGSHYKGEFKNNLKDGVGRFVTNSGLIIQHKKLFIDDNLGPNDEQSVNSHDNHEYHDIHDNKIIEPIRFDMYDDTVGLIYHIEEALKNLDKEAEIRAGIINEFFENNRSLEIDFSPNYWRKEVAEEVANNIDIEDLIRFEETSLRNCLRCYENDLRRIYHKYATICNVRNIKFTPILIRLYLWQLYYDCNMLEKGLTLVQIDNLFYKNSEWIAKTPHNPFEKIYYWQFLHSLIAVARTLYAERTLPKTKPHTIMACAFRKFMDLDILPGADRCKGHLVNGYGAFVPLRSMYELYCRIGEPHTVRQFLCEVRRAAHELDRPPPQLVDATNPCLPIGRNTYIFGDEINFITEEPLECGPDDMPDENAVNLSLFNFGNLKSRKIIRIFAKIFPQLMKKSKILNLDVEMTFFEFFEAFIACTEKSVHLQDEEALARLRKLMESSNSNQTEQPPPASAQPHPHQHPHK